MLQRAKIALGVAAVGMTMALVPAVSASAGVASVTSVRSLQENSICKAYQANTKAEEKQDTPAYTKALETGNWSAIQKLLLSSFKTESSASKALTSALGSAPGNVKSAASVIFKFDGTLKGIVQKSTSMTQFTSGITAAESAPKVKSALATLDAYSQKLCPGIIPTTPTT